MFGRHLALGRTVQCNQRHHRRRLPGEVPWQRVSQLDDRRTCPLCDSQSHAARDQSLIGLQQGVKHGIKRSGSQPSNKGPTEHFTGTVRIDPLFQANAPSRTLGASVTFEPCARTAWHTHPLGQTLIVTAGCGRIQRRGGPIEEIRPGDVVRIQPGEKHWHGASPTVAMTHIAIQEELDGQAVDWMEKASDQQHMASPG